MDAAHIPKSTSSWRPAQGLQFGPLAGFYTLLFKSMGALSVCVSTGGGHLAPPLGTSWVPRAGGAVRGIRAPGMWLREQMAFRCLLAQLLHFLASPPHPPSLGDVGSMLLWDFKGFGSGGNVRGKIKPEVPFLVV